MVQYLPIYEQKYRKLIKHMLSTFKAEKRGLDKHTQPELKKRCMLKKFKKFQNAKKSVCLNN